MIVLGLHGGVTIGQHEPAAALVINGKVAAICEEERYLRIKSCYGYLPYYSIKACLEAANIQWEDIDLVVTPGSTYEDFSDRIELYLKHNFGSCPRIERIHHQMAHMSAAFYSSNFDESLVVSLDATGDGACSMIGYGNRETGIKVLDELPTNQSIGYFYTLMTYFLGFSDGDEYKVMGLAPYGKPTIDLSKIIKDTSTGWELDWTNIRTSPDLRSPFEPTYSHLVEERLGLKPRLPGQEMSQLYMDLASSTQHAFEKCLMAYMKNAQKQVTGPGKRNLCYAGGVALNCSANKQLLYSDDFEDVFVPPVASDRGLALGCAYYGAAQSGDKIWPLQSAYLGTAYSDTHIEKELKSNSIDYTFVEDPSEVAAQKIHEGKIIGWFQGRSEAGARALGNRSILAACNSASMKEKVNAKIKYRESFRPFAPAAAYDGCEKYFYTSGKESPWMCFTVDVVKDFVDDIQAVAHVDNTARLQTVKSSNNECLYDLIKKYENKSGVPVVMNTSFNLKGQPIVETPRDSIMTFYGCGLDALFLGNYLVEKK